MTKIAEKNIERLATNNIGIKKLTAICKFLRIEKNIPFFASKFHF